jgi:hypothetical protein
VTKNEIAIETPLKTLILKHFNNFLATARSLGMVDKKNYVEVWVFGCSS